MIFSCDWECHTESSDLKSLQFCGTGSKGKMQSWFDSSRRAFRMFLSPQNPDKLRDMKSCWPAVPASGVRTINCDTFLDQEGIILFLQMQMMLTVNFVGI